MKILIFDNYDSFTYNIAHLVKELGYKEVEVHRNDKIRLEEIEKFDKIILSPGPGIPSEAGLLLPLIRQFAPTKSLLGICLGHQAIAEAFGGKLINMEDVYHGVATPVKVIAPHRIFDGLPESFEAGRYHSWLVSNEDFPAELTVTATDEKGQIMALKHKKWEVHGLQFHPESILTPYGKEIVARFLNG
ncbi:MAG: aminodeoxychorismate/anthranilate synthase component II [Candidatus Azobacteroides sp.]|nr:aminodeoxychorismate/anthranilate synthase component II [Candidatus Azobacteroides sp.]